MRIAIATACTGLVLMLTMASCQNASHLRIRSQEVIKEYQLLYLRGSTLIVQDWAASRAGTWRTLAEISLYSIDTIWQLEANRNRNAALGAAGGVLAILGSIYAVPEVGYALAFGGPAVLLLVGLPVVGFTALLGSALPAGEYSYLQGDP